MTRTGLTTTRSTRGQVNNIYAHLLFLSLSIVVALSLATLSAQGVTVDKSIEVAKPPPMQEVQTVTHPAEFQIAERFMTENRYYQRARQIEVKGIILHSIGTPQPSATPILLNYNSSKQKVGFHAVIEGSTVCQTLPWNWWAGHCGSGVNGSGNDSYIGVEMTEPEGIEYVNPYTVRVLDYETSVELVNQNYDTAVQLFAYLCRKYKLNPLEDGVILSHAEAHDRGIASNHGDPEHLWKHFGLTMDGFRQDVESKLNSDGSSLSSLHI